MAKLIVIEGPDAGHEHDLPERNGDVRRVLTAGRDPRAEVPIQDNAVSRRHFALELSPRGWRVMDLGSRNQTFLNGEVVKDRLLTDGDLIRAGDTELRFENPGEPLEPIGASTILKELPAGKPKDTLLARLASLEDALTVPPGSSADAAARNAIARVSRLLEAFASLVATNSIGDLYAKLIAETVPALGAHRGAIVLRDGTGWVLKAAHSSPGSAALVSVSDSLLEKVMEEKKAVLCANTLEGGPAAAAEVLSALAVPIVSQGKTVGVLYVERRPTAPPFNEVDLQVLAALGEPAGLLFEKIETEEHLRKENRNLFRSITESKRIIGRSPATEETLEFIRRAAPTPMTVLVQGETGTGKELVASAIHYSSPRRGRPFVAINCAALPENLVESELFGHERGAFTGAVTRRKGRFEMADTGTVFLDEVGELTLACQAKLLRLIEDRQFERVGGTESVKVDVRIIAATNKDLQGEVGKGAFREDLFYRLSVLNVLLPPLRERPEDIPLLAAHFLEGCGSPKKLSKPAEKKLAAYAWPGNVRQLRNALESAVVLGDGAEIEANDLLLPTSPGAENAAARGGWEPITLEHLERMHIQRVLEHTQGNKKRAAELLGIERCTLYAKLKSYGLAPVRGGGTDE